METIQAKDLRELFRNNSDCYTQVWITGKGYEDEPGMSEDKFVELVTKILTSKELNIKES